MEPLLSVQEAAAVLGLAPQTLYNWRTRGGGPKAVKVGGRLRYRRRDIELWLAARTQDRTPAPALSRRRAS